MDLKLIIIVEMQKSCRSGEVDGSSDSIYVRIVLFYLTLKLHGKNNRADFEFSCSEEEWTFVCYLVAIG